MPAEKRFLAFVDWIDSDVIDTDEISVFAEDAVQAESRVRAIWNATNRAAHQHCRIERIRILDLPRLRTLAES